MYTTDIPTASVAGTYTIYYKFTPADEVKFEAVTGSVSATIKPKSNQSWTISMSSYTYDGTAHTPTVNGSTYGSVTYKYYNADTGAQLSGAPSNAGNYKVEVSASGNSSYNSYKLVKNYTISPKSIASVTVKLAQNEFAYDGTAKTPAVTVFDGTNEIASSNYVIEYSKNTEAGTATVTITGTGNYKDSKTASFSIVKSSYSVTVTSGTANGTANGEFEPDTIITLAPDAPNEGCKFAYWRVDGRTIYTKNYTFRLTKDNVQAQAFYVENTDNIKYYAVCAKNTVVIDKTNNKLSFVYDYNVPENCSIVNCGIVATSDAEQAKSLAIGNAQYEKVNTTTVHNLKYTWIKSKVTADQTWYVKGYLTYKDADGKVTTIYSDLETTTLEGTKTDKKKEILGTAFVDNITVNNAAKSISFDSMFSVPADCTIKKAGILATSDAEKSKNLTEENAEYVRLNTTTVHNLRYKWTKTKVTSDQTWYVKPCLVYTDADGEEFTVYGEVKSAKLG